METYNTTDVFTPTRQAKLTFIERLGNDLNNDLVDALRTPGTQIVIYGHSGTGKSTLLFNVVNRIYENIIITRCTSDITYEQLILDAFDRLNIYYEATSTKKNITSIGFSLSGEYLFLKSSLNATRTNESTTTSQRLLPPQLTAQRLAEFMGAANCCWIIEDFHKTRVDQKTKLSEQLKVFVDTSEQYPNVKTILIGAVNTAREVIEYNQEMHNRVVELFVPILEEDELHKILEKGEELLNIIFTQKMKNEIVKFSSGLASITHRIALNMCQANNIEFSQSEKISFTEKDLVNALKKYVNSSSDTLRRRFESATKVDRVRKYNNGKIILEALSNLEFGEVHQNALLVEIKKTHPDYPQGNLSMYLDLLQKTEKGEVIILNPNNGKYSFSDPLIRTYIKCIRSIEHEGNLDPRIKERKLKEAMELIISEVFKE